MSRLGSCLRLLRLLRLRERVDMDVSIITQGTCAHYWPRTGSKPIVKWCTSNVMYATLRDCQCCEGKWSRDSWSDVSCICIPRNYANVEMVKYCAMYHAFTAIFINASSIYIHLIQHNIAVISIEPDLCKHTQHVYRNNTWWKNLKSYVGLRWSSLTSHLRHWFLLWSMTTACCFNTISCATCCVEEAAAAASCRMRACRWQH